MNKSILQIIFATTLSCLAYTGSASAGCNNDNQEKVIFHCSYTSCAYEFQHKASDKNSTYITVTKGQGITVSFR